MPLFLPGPGPWLQRTLVLGDVVAVEAVIPLDAAVAVSDATLALTAPALLTLETAGAQSAATLAVTAPFVDLTPDVVMATMVAV